MKPTGRGSNPRSRANLKPFKPGVSGNPGGVQKGVVYLSEAYKRLLKLSPDDILRYHARTTAEELALVQIKTAMAIGSPDSKLTKLGRFTLPAAKEIADRTEGKAKQRIDLDTQADLRLRLHGLWSKVIVTG